MLKNILKIFTSHVLVKAIGLINITLVLSFLSVNDFGEYSYYLVLLHLVTIVVDPFLSSYLFDYKQFKYKRYNFAIIIIPIILLPLFYLLLVNIKNDLNIILFILFNIYFISNAVLKSFLNAKEQYFSYGFVDLLRQVGILLSTLLVVYILKENNFLKLLIINYSTALLISSLSFLIFIRGKNVQFKIESRVLDKIIVNSKYLILFTALVPFISFIDSYFVDTYLSSYELGQYSFSLKIFNVSLLMMIPFNIVLNIEQIELAKSDGYYIFFNKNKNKVLKTAITVFIVSILLNWIITFYLFKEYRPSFWITNILLLATFFIYISIPFSFLIAYRKYKLLFILAFGAIIINFLINYCFIEEYGIMIAAISTFVSYIIINLGGAILSYNLFKRN